MKHHTLAVAAACALCVAMPASAASNASASLSGFSVTLYDLAPSDGIAPSISYLLQPYGSFVSTSANDSAAGSQSGTAFSLMPFGPASSTSTAGVAAATATVAGSLGSSLMMSAAGSAGGAALPGFGSSFGADAYFGNFSLGFTLSPFTLAVFQGSIELLAQTTLGAEPGDFFFNTESASANASISVSGPAPGGGSGGQNSSDGRSIFASFQQVFNPNTGNFEFIGETQTVSGVSLAGSFTNFSAGTLQGNLQVNTNVSGFSSVTVVPEPGTWALWLAGLAGVGAVARRRRA